MVDITIQTSDLSAVEVTNMTGWPDEMVEDYLTIIRNTVAILQGLQDFEEQINDNTEAIALLAVRVTQNESDIAQLEITVVDLQTQITENFTYLHGPSTKSDDYNPLGNYVKYDLVTEGDNEFICVQDTPNPAGVFDPLLWRQVSTTNNAILFEEHIDQNVEPDPHPQYQFKQPAVSMYGTADNFTLNATASRIDNYQSKVAYSGGNASNADQANGTQEIAEDGTYKVTAYLQGTKTNALTNETVELILDVDATQVVIDSKDLSNTSSDEVTLKAEFMQDFTTGDTLSLYGNATDDFGAFTVRYTTFEVEKVA